MALLGSLISQPQEHRNLLRAVRSPQEPSTRNYDTAAIHDSNAPLKHPSSCAKILVQPLGLSLLIPHTRRCIGKE